MKMTAKFAAFFLTLGLSLRLEAYDFSLQKYEVKNGKSYCFELFEQVFKIPYNKKPEHHFSLTGSLVCLQRTDGKALVNELHTVEFSNRFSYRSNEITLNLMNKATLVTQGHRIFLEAVKKRQDDCQQNTTPKCLTYRYINKRESDLLLNDYNTVLLEIDSITFVCTDEALKAGICTKTTISDPYLGTAPAVSNLTAKNIEKLNLAYKSLSIGKQMLQDQVAKLLSLRGVK
jgi:hypothetical protein